MLENHFFFSNYFFLVDPFSISLILYIGGLIHIISYIQLTEEKTQQFKTKSRKKLHSSYNFDVLNKKSAKNIVSFYFNLFKVISAFFRRRGAYGGMERERERERESHFNPI